MQRFFYGHLSGPATAPILSPVVSDYMIDRYQNRDLPIAGSMLLQALGVVLVLRQKPENKFESVPAASSGVAANGAAAHAHTAAVIK